MEVTPQTPSHHPQQRQSRAKVLMVIIVVTLLSLLLVVEVKRRVAEKQLRQLSMRLEQLTGGTQDKEAAKAVIEKVSKLYSLPTDVDPTVATIVDVQALRQRSPFYNKAENGDHLVITADRAILYRPSKNVIVDVVPVQLPAQNEQPQQPAGGNRSSAAR